MSAPGLDANQRRLLGELADVLIPRSGKMPSATDVGVEGRWIDRALASRADLAPALAGVLAAAGRDGAAAELARLERDAPATLEDVKLLVAGSYYMSPRVRKLIGYPGQSQHPILVDEAEHYHPDELLAPVLARGIAYRAKPAPSSSAGS